MGALEIAEIDDVHADFHQHTGERRVRNHRGDGAHAQHHGHQHQRVDHARQAGHAAGADIDHRAHRGAGAGNAAEETRHRVAHALADQFLVGIVARAGHVVGHQRGEQAVDGTQHGENKGRFDHQHHGGLIENGQVQARNARWNVAQYRHRGQHQTEQRADRQRGQGAGHVDTPLGGPAEGDGQGHHAHHERGKIDVR